MKYITPLAVTLVQALARDDIVEIRNSSVTNTTLFNDYIDLDTPVLFSYSYYTSVEVYEDGSSEAYLYGDLRLLDLSTYYFEGDQDSIRMTVGWRNPMENAYDFTSINIIYQKDEETMLFTCDDGYGFGSQSTEHSDETTWLF